MLHIRRQRRKEEWMKEKNESPNRQKSSSFYPTNHQHHVIIICRPFPLYLTFVAWSRRRTKCVIVIDWEILILDWTLSRLSFRSLPPLPTRLLVLSVLLRQRQRSILSSHSALSAVDRCSITCPSHVCANIRSNSEVSIIFRCGFESIVRFVFFVLV